MRIEFLFADKTINLFVQLRENPAVQSWATHFLDGQTPIAASLHDFQERMTVGDDQINHHIQNLNEILDILDGNGYQYRGHRPSSVADLSHTHTNSIHRFFTHAQDWVNHHDIQDKENIVNLLQKVNDSVHLLEIFNPSRPVPIEQIMPGSAPDIQLSNHPDFREQGWWEMSEDMKQYHSQEPADIVLGQQILGKSILRSYFDQDDPNDWDTSGIHCNNRDLFIPLHRNARKEIYQSQHFKDWVIAHGQDPNDINYDFPIGDIINRHDVYEVFSRLCFSRGRHDIVCVYHPE